MSLVSSGAVQRPTSVGLRTWEMHLLPAARAESGEAELAGTRAPRTRGERSDRASQALRSCPSPRGRGGASLSNTGMRVAEGSPNACRAPAGGSVVQGSSPPSRGPDLRGGMSQLRSGLGNRVSERQKEATLAPAEDDSELRAGVGGRARAQRQSHPKPKCDLKS